MPFGAGRRICVGSTFALVEATLLLAMISQRYEFDLAAWAQVPEEAAITLRPKGGLEMIARPRAGRRSPTDRLSEPVSRS